ncbi:MAG TPA: GTP 3',8-cyclase MoaA [Steroidobacteraceae bacterium]|nr:GTP 3',8-cyclase MoaA [Steroidobacteraceae bacterium]
MGRNTGDAGVAALPGRGPVDRLGRPMRDLRISVMDRCNFRCPYCMPRETFHDRYRFLRASERLDFTEIARVARLATRLGVRKVRITGGEPLLRSGLADLVAEVSSLDGIEDVALTTNGVLLAQHAAELKGNGLHRVTVSLDSLDPEVFARMSGGFGGLEQVLEGIDAAITAGLEPVKVNAVVKRGVNDHTVLDLLERFRGTPVIVRLIEFMDVGTRNAWRAQDVVTSAELLRQVRARWPVSPVAGRTRGQVAERYRYDDGAGEIGFISSVSAPFCGDCSRARLSSEGVLYTCLFATSGLDLRSPLRAGATDDDLLALLRGAWSGRADRYSEIREVERAAGHALHKVEMHYIGG